MSTSTNRRKAVRALYRTLYRAPGAKAMVGPAPPPGARLPGARRPWRGHCPCEGRRSGVTGVVLQRVRHKARASQLPSSSVFHPPVPICARAPNRFARMG